MYLGPPCYGYAFNCHLVYLEIPGTRPLCIKKQNLFVLFICNRKKVKFKFVQLNMKQVSYSYTAAKLWYSIQIPIHNASSLTGFKDRIKSML